MNNFTKNCKCCLFVLNKIILFSILVIAFILPAATKCDLIPPAEHNGANLICSDGDIIWGIHTGIDEFKIPSGAVVQIADYDGSDTKTGMAEIHASKIIIEGYLLAVGVGYTGGSGGGGGGGYLSGYIYGGGGSAGLSRYGNFCGTNGGNAVGWPGGHAGIGGSGSTGDGSFPGSYGTNGGYAAISLNGDTSIDKSLRMGSGGGGASGESGSTMGGPGGVGGGSGGGIIKLIPTEFFKLSYNAYISASGEPCNEGLHLWDLGGGSGGNGYRISHFPYYYSFPNIASGAGGGILLDIANTTVIDIENLTDSYGYVEKPNIETLGGYQDEQNGGTVKIFDSVNAFPFSKVNVSAGRILNINSSPAKNWHLYE